MLFCVLESTLELEILQVWASTAKDLLRILNGETVWEPDWEDSSRNPSGTKKNIGMAWDTSNHNGLRPVGRRPRRQTKEGNAARGQEGIG